MTEELKEYLFENQGCRLHYWLAGEEDAPLLVFSHGAYIDHHEWDSAFPLVLAKGFRVLTWDMRGHGQSRPGDFSMAQSVTDLIGILDEIHAPQATFIGHSLGGNLHQELVFHHPQRVKSLVIEDSTWNFQKLSRLEEWGVKVGMPMLGWYPYHTLITQMANITTDNPEGRAYLVNTFSRLTKQEFVNIMTEGTRCLHEEPGYVIPRPFLLLVADHDMTGNIRKIAPIWAAHEPNCQFVVIPNAKHGAHFDAPDFFFKVLFEFLEKNAR